ncbi:VOC family protein [Streptomyces sp. NPDC058045]|uniref:VOC family protein n=1 Tax=Streptomyces sp. NPDC058045 TaxID=3346311 RepID=UPI0036E37A58
MENTTTTTAMSLFHHVGLFPTDLAATERLYTAALAPLGIVAGSLTDDGIEYWHRESDTPSFCLSRPDGPRAVSRGMHLAFTADSRAEVDAFHTAALAAGATSRHAPRRWPEYRAYCAFVTDLDGNNVEAVFKEPAPEAG